MSLLRQLGLGHLKRPAGASTGRIQPLAPLWKESRTALGQRLEALRQTMLSQPDGRFAAVANHLDGALEGEAALLSVLADYDASPDGPHAAKLRQAALAFGQSVRSSRAVALIDANPFAIAVDMQATVLGTLGRITAALDPH